MRGAMAELGIGQLIPGVEKGHGVDEQMTGKRKSLTIHE